MLLKLNWRPTQLRAAYHVQVQIRNRLTCSLSIIDHHATDGWSLSEHDLALKWDVRSTTEVIANYLLHHAPQALSQPVCEFLLAGLVTDTARFRHADGPAFATAAALIEAGELDYQAFIQELEDTTTSPSERGAILRGLKRVETTEAGPWTVLRTTAGTLEGRLASMLNGLGADAVVVTRHRDGQTRLTARAPRSTPVPPASAARACLGRHTPATATASSRRQPENWRSRGRPPSPHPTHRARSHYSEFSPSARGTAPSAAATRCATSGRAIRRR